MYGLFIEGLIGNCWKLATYRSGVIAQLVERLNGIEEVWGSNPHGSIKQNLPPPDA